MSERIALDQWPHDIDPVLQEAFDIALEYLEFTGQAFPFQETQEECARIIIDEWNAGRKRRIWLAHKAIAAIELKRRHIAGNGNVTTLTRYVVHSADGSATGIVYPADRETGVP